MCASRETERQRDRETVKLYIFGFCIYFFMNNNFLDFTHFQSMTRSVLGVGSEPAIGNGGDTREGTAAGEGSEQDLGRGFQRKQQSALLGLLTRCVCV